MPVINELIELCYDNKYTKWYTSIVEGALNRTIQGYTEKHHILPKSIVKNSDVVRLTAREHFVCHLLLPKMLKDEKHRRKMKLAIHRLVHGNKNDTYCKSSYIYEMIQQDHREVASQRSKDNWNDPVFRAKMIESRKNIVISEEEKQRRRLRCYRMIEARKANYTPDKHPLRLKGGHSEESKAKMSLTAKLTGKGKGSKNSMFGKEGAAKNKKWYHNPITKQEKYYTVGKEESGFIPGRLKRVA